MVEKQSLKLYVAGNTARSRAAINGLKKFLETRGLSEVCDLTVIDVLENPLLAEADKVLAVPMVVRNHPRQLRVLVGDMSNGERLLRVLDL